jgi:diguanylate cyclase (GGDEF)-like protein
VDGPSIPLPGADGSAVAWLVWDPPRPGTDQLWHLAPPLLVVLLAAVALLALGTSLVQRSAEALVHAEGLASRAARTDPLTQLPNRGAFNAALAAPARPGERAVLFLDVNDFKRINDSIGHDAGDQVILGLARLLERFSGPGCFLARIAGDEFVFIVTGAEAEARTCALAEEVCRALQQPFVVFGHEMRVELAMGYAVQASGQMTGPDLVRQADLAMYEAKRHKGQSGLVAFDEVIAQASRQARVIERGLRRALDGEGELTIVYQPIVGPDGRLVRAEALARWTSGELGPVPPDLFIPVAEQAGLMVPLGRRILQLVCEDLVRYPALRVSMNISTLQLMAPDFLPSFTRQLSGCGIAPHRIEVELTEGVLVDDARLAAERLRELRAAGFSIALDDFGTGYSSMGYLERLGFDTLKMDRSVVGRIRGPAGGTEVVRGIIIMAHGFGMRVVCEGVETEEDLRRLLELGCDLVQGHHLSAPQPIELLVARWMRPCGAMAAVA